jgi:hypothetical protein
MNPYNVVLYSYSLTEASGFEIARSMVEEVPMKTWRARYVATAPTVLLIAVFAFIAVMLPAAGGKGEMASSQAYQERPALETSLFPSDVGVLGEEAIRTILSSKFVMPSSLKIALFRLRDDQQTAVQYYGYGYWTSEEYLKTQQSYIDTLSDELSKSGRIEEAASIPSVLTPKEPSLPLIRETGVRLQADMILVFKLSSDVYQKYRFLRTTQAKAYCTCEGFLFDVRTGIIPFSRTITKEYLATKGAPDANFNETMVRAQKEAVLLALKDLAQQVVEFVESMPGGEASPPPDGAPGSIGTTEDTPGQ